MARVVLLLIVCCVKLSLQISEIREAVLFQNNDLDFQKLDINIGNSSMESMDVKELIAQEYKTHGFNKYLSDRISLNRGLPDFRRECCFWQDINRPKQPLLPTSVIISFHNAARSVLLRSVHSILSRSQSHLLSEIILVDDFSDLEELSSQLEYEILKLPKVKLIRLSKRGGLHNARMAGSKIAVAPIFTFLDPYVEVTEGWLDPLLESITKSWKVISTPVIDYIDPDTLSYNPVKERHVGGFDWNLRFVWRSRADTLKEKNHTTPAADPFPTPTMHGSVFSIHKNLFIKIENENAFDIESDTTNLEMSFKTWMCGGRIEIVPCSHVGLIGRKLLAPAKNEKLDTALAKLADGWLDEYSEFYYAMSHSVKALESEDSIRILNQRRSMNCSSFDLYMKSFSQIVFNPHNSLAFGEVMNEFSRGIYCLDGNVNEDPRPNKPSLYWSCHKEGGNQNWYFTKIGEIRTDENCLEIFGTVNVTVLPCHGLGGNQHWEYHPDTGLIISTQNSLCLTLEPLVGNVQMFPCIGETNQRWKFKVDRIFKQYGRFDFSTLKSNVCY